MPYPNKHAARLINPDKFTRFRRGNDKFGDGIHAVWGIKNGKVELQAIRFDKEKFTVSEAKDWLKEHDYKPILFEPATGGKFMEIIKGKVKTIDSELQLFKAVESVDGERIIEGYFSTIEPDRGGDITIPTAFNKSMKTYLKNPIVTFMHDWKKPLGKTLEYRVDDKGVWVKILIAKGVQWIDETWELIKQGVIKALSYGYRTYEEEKVQIEGKTYNQLKELELLEIAVVTVPMNASALFTISRKGIKSITIAEEEAKSSPDLSVLAIKFNKELFTFGAVLQKLDDWKIGDFIADSFSDSDNFLFKMKANTPLDKWATDCGEGIGIEVQTVDGEKGEISDVLDEENRRFDSDLWRLWYICYNKLIALNIDEEDVETKAFELLDEYNVLAKKRVMGQLEIHYEDEERRRLQNTEMGVAIKAGRILSEKNRKLISECVSSMGGTKNMLNNLLTSQEEREGEANKEKLGEIIKKANLIIEANQSIKIDDSTNKVEDTKGGGGEIGDKKKGIDLEASSEIKALTLDVKKLVEIIQQVISN